MCVFWLVLYILSVKKLLSIVRSVSGWVRRLQDRFRVISTLGHSPLGQEYLIFGVGAYIWGAVLTQFLHHYPSTIYGRVLQFEFEIVSTITAGFHRAPL